MRSDPSSVRETPILTLTDDEGGVGTGYTYTIGSGGSSIVALMRDHLLPRVIGMDTETLEANWRSLLFGMHAWPLGRSARWQSRRHHPLRRSPITLVIGRATPTWLVRQ